ANNLMERVKKVYIERVVRSGCEDGGLYNDELLKLDAVDVDEFNRIGKAIGRTKAQKGTTEIDVNKQGLTDEEYKKAEDAKKKPKKERTPEDEAAIAEQKMRQEMRQNAISVLRSISIRMPLLIYGAEIDDEKEEITIDNFENLIDTASWNEFMPTCEYDEIGTDGKKRKIKRPLSKAEFRRFKKYYDPDIFIAAAKRIRQIVRNADEMPIEQRISRIADIFSTFRNPDKETVLTPWRVVNMHMSDTLGGYTFFNEDFTETIEEPRFVGRGNVTAEVFNPEAHLLEINSKTGLYPLLLTYNAYRARLRNEWVSPQTVEEHQAIWDAAVRDNVFVICKTKMAKSITRRTLLGFRNGKANMWAPDDLINKIKNQPELFTKKVYDLVGKNVKINAITGNPPYQIMDGGGTGSSAIPVYNDFVNIAINLKPKAFSMIMPAKWYSGGRGLDSFREQMLNDTHISNLIDFQDSRDCFPTVDIAGGVCYFLWDDDYDGECNITNHSHGTKTTEKRYLNAFDTFIRDSRIIDIINKVMPQTSSPSLAQKVYSRKPFGLRSFDKGFPAKPGRNIALFGSDGISYLSEEDVPQNLALAPKWKVIMSKASAEHAGQTDKEGRKRIVSRLEVLQPGTICTESYLLLDVFDTQTEAENLKSYMRTQFVRFLLGSILLTQNIVRDKFRFVPLQDFTEGSDIDWSKPVKDIDRQLYVKYGLTSDEVSFIESMIKPM
ncbi:MAG: Eco57I restriction-modification methylase domain-containing protein, partial [Muribaculum sp.]|nr:Eco57I restriction-modification methylase domain-containing protein [Muribaculum sp.]